MSLLDWYSKLTVHKSKIPNTSKHCQTILLCYCSGMTSTGTQLKLMPLKQVIMNFITHNQYYYSSKICITIENCTRNINSNYTTNINAIITTNKVQSMLRDFRVLCSFYHHVKFCIIGISNNYENNIKSILCLQKVYRVSSTLEYKN